jgi:4-hydroxy-2,2'-bipyrrole-5-carbaldehyde O-methyltransferase
VDDVPVSYVRAVAASGLHLPHKLAHGLVARDLTTWLRVQFLATASRLGLLAALAEAPCQEDLAGRLGVSDSGMLTSLLQLGAALGEIRQDGDRWALKGSRAKAVADPAADPLAGILEEVAGYDADVYRALPGRLRGEAPGDYLPEAAEVVARASRLAEPLLGALVRDVVRRFDPARVLDVGCGTGTYLRHVAEASRTATGAGIDTEPDVVALATRNLSGWELTDRFSVTQADVRGLPELAAELAGPWDLVLLFQNIYYFPAIERPGILARLRTLAPRGRVVVATTVAGTGDAFAAHLDLVLRSTVGNHPLPTIPELHEALRAAGFAMVEERRLAPRQPLRAFVAS